MARHHVERILPYAAEQLFTLVGDVRAYPEFVPWIRSLRTGPERAEGEGVTALDADAAVGFSFLKERFSTRVRLDADALLIDVSLISGPFRRLSNQWRFQADPLGTKIIFDIDFEFKSKLLDIMLRANFDLAVGRLISCFEERAKALYPPIPLIPANAGT
jgi:coenzyme Q-binding protein COQ10